MTKKEMQLELWKAMHGMVIPMPFLKDQVYIGTQIYTGSGYEIFSGNL